MSIRDHILPHVIDFQAISDRLLRRVVKFYLFEITKYIIVMAAGVCKLETSGSYGTAFA
jgi:hypothetical protein